jgi:hypothetical protein
MTNDLITSDQNNNPPKGQIILYSEGQTNINVWFEWATCKEYLQVQNEGGRQVKRLLKHYSLEVVLTVGGVVAKRFYDGRPTNQRRKNRKRWLF